MPRASRPNLSAQNRLLFPSNMETMSSSAMPGKTSSFLDHTPLPYGHEVVATRPSNSLRQ